MLGELVKQGRGSVKVVYLGPHTTVRVFSHLLPILVLVPLPAQECRKATLLVVAKTVRLAKTVRGQPGST